jgi:endo-1,4-beta-xylanase
MRLTINANVRATALALACVVSACATPETSSDGTGGSTSGSGGTNAGSGGTSSQSGGTTGTTATGGISGTGGAVSGSGGASKGGETGSGGAAGHLGGTGGAASGGVTGHGGAGAGSGGAAGGSAAGHGGSGSGGATATGGALGTGGAKGGSSGTGGIKGTGGATGTGGTTGSGGSSVNCTGSLPSGGTTHSGDSQGSAAGLTWQLWMNGSNGTMTTYSTPAFSANWNNSGDFLARIGLSWGSGKAYTSLGTVSADFAETKSGSAGGYSYIGIYGWSVNPCVEWYIVDDSYGNLPFNPGGSMVGTATIDGGTYNIIARSTTGTGGNRCGNVSSWNQIYSMRTSKRTCGTISITDHWNAWAKANQQLGSMLEASILIEAGGGSGSISFPTANVTAQ